MPVGTIFDLCTKEMAKDGCLMYICSKEFNQGAMMKLTKNKEQIEEYKETLKGIFPKGSTVYTVIRHVSSSGMTRDVGIVGIFNDPRNSGKLQTVHPNYAVACLLGLKHEPSDRRDCVRIEGCGMNMCFEIVYRLAIVLYGDGYALTQESL